MIYLGLFFAAFLAATVVPAQSEAVMVALLLADYPVASLIIVASAGNILGSTVNWWLGSKALQLSSKRWFPLNPARLERVSRWYSRYGRWSLLLSWVPVIGDPLTLAAGLMREPLRTFLPLVALAKTGRYVALAWMTLGLV
ncbi:hypothetical protein C7E19_09130 [Stenotrophomonas maltophilia]|nr:hypothetical protein C7E19_09130 [Stenotrophomonas maltophilia]